jgi:hypothetical protein
MDAGLRRFLRAPLLVLAGLGCGISPAFFGYFDLSVWGPISLGVLAVAVALVVAEPAVPTGLGGLATLALLLLGGWCLLSMGWAESADRALTEGDRWVLYAAFLLVLMLLVRDREDGEIFIAAALVGILCIAGYDLVKMLAGEGQDLFGETRLLEPLGYINGMGGFFLLGLWPLIAIAERARAHALAGLAAGGATLLCALVLLTESRGTLFAFGASALAILALFPGRRRRAWLLLAVLAGLAIAWGPLTDVTQPLAHGQIAPDADLIRRGAEWSVGVSALVAIVWGVGGWAVDSLGSRSPASARSLPVVSSVLLGGIAAAAAIAMLAAVHDPVQKVRDQYDAFTSLHKVQAGSRLTAGGGNRYDYWRIAWHQFTDHPLDGVGAGNFDRTYFLERRTDEDVRQAHSIELQALGETGLVGGLLLAAFVAAVSVGMWRWSRAGPARNREIGLGLGAAGMFLVWLAQTSVDWLHLIPGLTGLALGGAAILLSRPGLASDGARGAGLGRIPIAGVVGIVALAAAAIVLVGRPTLALHYRTEAQGELRSDPRRALDTVHDSLSLNPDAVQSYYTEAAAFARLGGYRQARLALGEAIDREPHNYVSWALLGDLETRRGAIRGALRSYGRASRLNPRDRELRLLASSPRLIGRLHREPDGVGPIVESEEAG